MKRIFRAGIQKIKNFSIPWGAFSSSKSLFLASVEKELKCVQNTSVHP